MSTTQPYFEDSVQEALLILDDAKNLQTAEELSAAIDFAVQKLRPVESPRHDAAALEQFTVECPSCQGSGFEDGMDHGWACKKCDGAKAIQVERDAAALEQLALKYPIELPWMQEDRCTMPPAGWVCTRKAGHEGPCAALQAPTKPSKCEPAFGCAMFHRTGTCTHNALVVADGVPSDGGKPNCLNSDSCAGCKPGMIAVRSYEFEGGLLHLELAAVAKMSDEEVAEECGQGKGKLLDVREGQMPVRQFYALGDFRDM